MTPEEREQETLEELKWEARAAAQAREDAAAAREQLRAFRQNILDGEVTLKDVASQIKKNPDEALGELSFCYHNFLVMRFLNLNMSNPKSARQCAGCWQRKLRLMVPRSTN